jgi:endonuclease/exonuclease/phosphatase family metal-dependent hydrolase
LQWSYKQIFTYRYYIIFFGLLSYTAAQSDYTFLTYNLLNYGDDDDRESYYQEIIGEIQPDLIVCQEVLGTTGYNHFLDDVLNIIQPNEWFGADFTNQSASQDIALYYKLEHFSFISTATINTAQSSGTRDVVEWVMEHLESGVQFRVYSLHLKASSGDNNAQERLEETTILRNYLNELPSGSHFIIGGDFNIYSNNSSSEPAFDMLTAAGPDTDGQLFDPINRIGHWHNNNAFADVHTQSPRTTQFGGGANGGMDDRFDWIFASAAVLEDTYDMNYVDDTYIAFGNDGQHFNQAINSGTNDAVSQTMADALHAASDHLPVFASFQFPDGDASDFHLIITEIMPDPATVSDSRGEWFEILNADSIVIDLNGWTIMDEGSDTHVITTTNEIAPGQYMVFGRNGNEAENGGYTADYIYSSFQLRNEDEIIILDGDDNIVDNVSYGDTFPYSIGISMYLKNVTYNNNLDTSWAASFSTYGDGDMGTPGRAWDDTTIIAVITDDFLPEEIKLYPSYPNPFNPKTTISVSIANAALIKLNIYDVNGRLVDILYNSVIAPGHYQLAWHATNKPSGIYFVLLESAGQIKTQKLVLMK